jgi:3-oxoacyl-[acyl-carrier protein] reductase
MIALVTGGGGAIGAATARQLAGDGATVAVADLDLAKAEQVAAGIDGATAHPLDVTDSAQVDALVAELGSVSILANVAGFPDDCPITKMTDEVFNRVVAVSLFGTFACSRAVAPGMIEAGFGRIVNVASRAYLGNPGQVNYSAAKAGVVGFTRALSLELGRHGITVNAVAPGMIDTPLVRAHPKWDDIAARAVKASAVKRLGEPDDVAAAIAWLASPASGYVSGDVIHVSGGRFG